MAYNQAWGGTIPFPENSWQKWYTHWIIQHENKRFYRYLLDTESQLFVGEVAYYYDTDFQAYLADIIIPAQYRGKGYGR